MNSNGLKPEALMTRDEIARLLDRGRSTITRYATLDGMPVAEGGGSGKQARYLPSACVAWLLAQIEARYVGMEGLNPQRERALRDRAQAELARQLHERRSGDLLAVDDVRLAWSNIVGAIRSRLLSMPTALAERLAPVTEAAAVEQILKAEVYLALRELANWTAPETRGAGHRNGTRPAPRPNGHSRSTKRPDSVGETS